MRQPAQQLGSGCGSAFLLFWLTFWSAGTLLFDGFCIKSLYDQFSALSLPFVVGNITHSKLVVEHDSDGSSERADIGYEYFVGGKKYTGDNVRFGMIGMGEASELVNRHPVGSETPVYYDPAKPERAALQIGLSPWDFFLPMFLMPFNMVMLGGLGFALGAAKSKLWGRTSTLIKTRDLGVATQFRVFTASRVLMAMIAAGGIGFVSVFLFAFGQTLLPAWPLLIVLWIVLFTGVGYAFLAVTPKCIEVNTLRETLKLPRTSTRSETIEFRDVTGLKASRDATKSGNSGKLEIYYKEQDNSSKTKIPCASLEDAEWLRTKLSELMGRPELA